jgi:hypothetical protein
MREPIEHEWRDLGVAGGAVAAVLVAGALVGARSLLDNTSVALVLVLVVVGAAAVGGRRAGMTTALMAGIAFDFFHTEPYGRLTIDSAQDVETVLLLVAVGLAAGEIVVRARALERRGTMSHDELERVRRAVAGASAHPDDVVELVLAELREGLGLERCWFEAGPTDLVRPEIGPRGTITRTVYRVSGGEFELPDDEIALPVRLGTTELGRFVLVPTRGIGVARDRRIAAAAMADVVGLTLGRGVSTRP